MENILKLLERDARLTNSQLAAMLGTDEEKVAREIKRLENDHVILGYKTVIDWEKTDKEVVTAIIEVRVTPQRGEGFEKVAERIYQFEEVDSLYLMSGGFDLAVTVTAGTMSEPCSLWDAPCARSRCLSRRSSRRSRVWRAPPRTSY